MIHIKTVQGGVGRGGDQQKKRKGGEDRRANKNTTKMVSRDTVLGSNLSAERKGIKANPN